MLSPPSLLHPSPLAGRTPGLGLSTGAGLDGPQAPEGLASLLPGKAGGVPWALLLGRWEASSKRAPGLGVAWSWREESSLGRTSLQDEATLYRAGSTDVTALPDLHVYRVCASGA